MSMAGFYSVALSSILLYKFEKIIININNRIMVNEMMKTMITSGITGVLVLRGEQRRL